jgi:hypothetical protein
MCLMRRVLGLGCRAVTLALLALHGCKLDNRVVGGRDAGLGAGRGGRADEEPPDASGGLVDGPRLVVARDALDFGAAVTGFAALARVVVENGGDVPIGAPVFTLAEGSDPDFSIAQDQCGRALVAGARCDVRLQLVPSKPGPLLGTLQIQSDPGGTASVALTGQGLAPGDIVVAPAPGASADYGDVPLATSVEAVFRVTNPVTTASGTLQASLASEGFTLVPPAEGECSFGTTSLEAGQACDVRIAFQPSVRGPSEATLSVSSANIGSASLALRGQGRAPGALGVSPEAVDFSGIVLGTSGAARIGVFNAGDEPVVIAGASIEGEGAEAFAIAATECAEGTVLEGGERPKSCAIDLAFEPAAAAASAATLRVASTSGLEVAVPLAGEGLLPGALTISPSGLTPGEDGTVDLGDIVIGESRAQAFAVSNGGAEPSGAITFAVSSGLTLVPGSAEGDCEPGVTALVDGQSCTLSVQIEPTERAPLSGSLTVTSELVGSASLALRARGISKGILELGADDVNFGRVVLGATAPGSLTLRNGGDQALEPPSVVIGRATSGSAAAFTFDNGCAAALAPGAECSIELTFAPLAAGAHSVTLEVGGAGEGGSTALLLGEGLEPGSLELAAVGAGGGAFGDVARGTTAERSFTVSNAGQVVSGPLTITTTSNQFVADEGDCNSAGNDSPGNDSVGNGLVDGSTCTFAVRFTPTSSNPATATLNIDSPGAGAASIALSGRGRNPPSLDGAGAFDFGVVIVTERSAPRLWTVSNGGDVPTGALSSQGATEEVLVSNDGCAGQVLPPGGECSLQVTFAPQQAGPRSGTLTVREAGAAGSSVSLGVSGTGQALPAVGQPCQGGRCAGDATCAIHSDGQTQVCCAVECPSTQRCDALQDFAACTLPVAEPGQACGPAVLCGAGFSCQPPEPSGRCCREDCTGACQVCDADGSCAQRDDGDVGGCAPGQDCQGGVCTDIPSPAALSADPTSRDFGEIVLDGESAPQPFVVTNVGQRATGALSVALLSPVFLADGGCDGVALEPGGFCTFSIVFDPIELGDVSAVVQVGDGSVEVSVSLAATGVCPAGQVPDGLGGCACPPGQVSDGLGGCACPPGQVSDGVGGCVCPPGQVSDGAGGCVALIADGQPCSEDGECASGTCTPFFRDRDLDGFFGGDAELFCGVDAPSFELSATEDDCCDLPVDPDIDFSTTTASDAVNPLSDFSDSRPATGCPLEYDFDCDGVEVQDELPVVFEACDPDADCLPTPGARRAGEVTCGDQFGLVLCGFDADGLCVELGDLADFVRCR